MAQAVADTEEIVRLAEQELRDRKAVGDRVGELAVLDKANAAVNVIAAGLDARLSGPAESATAGYLLQAVEKKMAADLAALDAEFDSLEATSSATAPEDAASASNGQEEEGGDDVYDQGDDVSNGQAEAGGDVYAHVEGDNNVYDDYISGGDDVHEEGGHEAYADTGDGKEGGDDWYDEAQFHATIAELNRKLDALLAKVKVCFSPLFIDSRYFSTEFAVKDSIVFLGKSKDTPTGGCGAGGRTRGAGGGAGPCGGAGTGVHGADQAAAKAEAAEAAAAAWSSWQGTSGGSATMTRRVSVWGQLMSILKTNSFHVANMYVGYLYSRRVDASRTVATRPSVGATQLAWGRDPACDAQMHESSFELSALHLQTTRTTKQNNVRTPDAAVKCMGDQPVTPTEVNGSFCFLLRYSACSCVVALPKNWLWWWLLLFPVSSVVPDPAPGASRTEKSLSWTSVSRLDPTLTIRPVSNSVCSPAAAA